jgi:DNA mismatch endonuclease (patch repair protein)
MASIKGRNTRPELLLRRELHKLGLRYRLHRRDLPGTPDLVFPKYRAAVFVHGCFWHLHAHCSAGRLPGTNRNFWEKKLNGNVKRDEASIEALRKLKWNTYVIWECEVEADPVAVAKHILNALKVGH